MKSKAIFLLGILASAQLLGCRPPPGRRDFQVQASGGGGATGGEPANGGTGNPKSGELSVELTEPLLRILQPSGGTQDARCSDSTQSSKSQLRLLTRDEYQNTVKDILMVTADFRSTLPTDAIVFGFPNNADERKISDAHASAYLDTAIEIAGATKSKLTTLVACEESTGLACAQKVVDGLAPKLWRRPLNAAEKTALVDLYKKGLAVSASQGMTLLLSNLLLSPYFLYRMEIGKENTLTAYELASALSYFFWGSSPDNILQGLAASGELSKEATLLAQAQRLLSDKRSKYTTAGFARGWLNSQAVVGDDKDAIAFPLFTDSIKTSMAAEAEDTFDFLLKQPNSTFETLFNSDFTVGPPKLATYYKGQSVVESGITKIKFPNTPRKGILGLGSILAHNSSPAETHPILRGNFVLDKIFCDTPPPTPANLDVQIPMFSNTLTTRQRFAEHTKNAACSICHISIDGIGFGMEDFDTVGIYRETDNGKLIDTAGEVVKIDGATTKFTGVGGLSSYIANSVQAKRCFVVEWYRFAHGHAESSADVCAIRDIANKFEKGSMSLSQLLITIITHHSYANKE